MKTKYLIAALLALGVAAPGSGFAQDRENDRERRMQEAEERLEAARRAVEGALRNIREHESDARRELTRAMQELQLAERSLYGWRIRDQLRNIVVLPGGDETRSWVRVFEDDRPRMGVILQNEGSGGANADGARIQAVTPGGPADEAGLKAGDVVTEIGGASLKGSGRGGERPGEKLARIVRESDEGDTLTVAYLRDGTSRSTRIVVRSLGPDAYAFGWSSDSNDVRFDVDLPGLRIGDVRMPRVDLAPLRVRLPHLWLDLELVTLDDQLGEYFGTREGLLVDRKSVV